MFLGVDPGVKIEFKPVKVKEGKAGMLKKSKTENTSHKIVVTNNKSNQVRRDNSNGIEFFIAEN